MFFSVHIIVVFNMFNILEVVCINSMSSLSLTIVLRKCKNNISWWKQRVGNFIPLIAVPTYSVSSLTLVNQSGSLGNIFSLSKLWLWEADNNSPLSVKTHCEINLKCWSFLLNLVLAFCILWWVLICSWESCQQSIPCLIIFL